MEVYNEEEESSTVAWDVLGPAGLAPDEERNSRKPNKTGETPHRFWRQVAARLVSETAAAYRFHKPTGSHVTYDFRPNGQAYILVERDFWFRDNGSGEMRLGAVVPIEVVWRASRVNGINALAEVLSNVQQTEEDYAWLDHHERLTPDERNEFTARCSKFYQPTTNSLTERYQFLRDKFSPEGLD